MRCLALVFASSLVLTGCGSGARMAAFICEDIPNESETYKPVTIDDLQGKLDKSESLAVFHKKQQPWTYDRETGDLYEYDDFEDALVPIKDFDTSFESDMYNRYWTEYSSNLSKDGKKLKIKSVYKVKNALLGERIEDEYVEIYDIESKTSIYTPGEENEKTVKCLEVSTAGLDIQWANEEISR